MNSLDNHLEAASGLRGPVEAYTNYKASEAKKNNQISHGWDDLVKIPSLGIY